MAAAYAAVPEDILSKICDGVAPVPDGRCEFEWPLATSVVRRFDWSANPCRIEPGEIEGLHFDFVVPAYVRGLQVYAFLRNPRKAKEEGWRKTSIYVLTGGTDGQRVDAAPLTDAAMAGQAVAGSDDQEEAGRPRVETVHQLGAAEGHSAATATPAEAMTR